MTTIYSVVEDGEETFMGVPIPRDMNVLYNSILKNIRVYTKGYFNLAINNRDYIQICSWKLEVYNRLLDDLESIVGVNKDTKELRMFIKSLSLPPGEFR